jgi:hypothetical protein
MNHTLATRLAEIGIDLTAEQHGAIAADIRAAIADGALDDYLGPADTDTAPQSGRHRNVGYVPDTWDCAGGCGKQGRHLNHADSLVYCADCLPKENS